MVEERRRHPRAAFPTVRVRLAATDGYYDEFMQDLSAGGMLLRTERTLPVGSHVEAEILRPHAEVLRVDGRVVRLELADAPEVPGMAIQFVGVPDVVGVDLEKLVEPFTLAFRTPQPAQSLATEESSVEGLGDEIEQLRSRLRSVRSGDAELPVDDHANSSTRSAVSRAEGPARSDSSQTGSVALLQRELERERELRRTLEVERDTYKASATELRDEAQAAIALRTRVAELEGRVSRAEELVKVAESVAEEAVSRLERLGSASDDQADDRSRQPAAVAGDVRRDQEEGAVEAAAAESLGTLIDSAVDSGPRVFGDPRAGFDSEEAAPVTASPVDEVLQAAYAFPEPALTAEVSDSDGPVDGAESGDPSEVALVGDDDSQVLSSTGKLDETAVEESAASQTDLEASSAAELAASATADSAERASVDAVDDESVAEEEPGDEPEVNEVADAAQLFDVVDESEDMAEESGRSPEAETQESPTQEAETQETASQETAARETFLEEADSGETVSGEVDSEHESEHDQVASEPASTLEDSVLDEADQIDSGGEDEGDEDSDDAQVADPDPDESDLGDSDLEDSDLEDSEPEDPDLVEPDLEEPHLEDSESMSPAEDEVVVSEPALAASQGDVDDLAPDDEVAAAIGDDDVAGGDEAAEDDTLNEVADSVPETDWEAAPSEGSDPELVAGSETPGAEAEVEPAEPVEVDDVTAEMELALPADSLESPGSMELAESMLGDEAEARVSAAAEDRLGEAVSPPPPPDLADANGLFEAEGPETPPETTDSGSQETGFETRVPSADETSSPLAAEGTGFDTVSQPIQTDGEDSTPLPEDSFGDLSLEIESSQTLSEWDADPAATVLEPPVDNSHTEDDGDLVGESEESDEESPAAPRVSWDTWHAGVTRGAESEGGASVEDDGFAEVASETNNRSSDRSSREDNAPKVPNSGLIDDVFSTRRLETPLAAESGERELSSDSLIDHPSEADTMSFPPLDPSRLSDTMDALSTIETPLGRGGVSAGESDEDFEVEFDIDRKSAADSGSDAGESATASDDSASDTSTSTPGDESTKSPPGDDELSQSIGPESVRTRESFISKLEGGSRLLTTDRFRRLEPVSRSDIQVSDWLEKHDDLSSIKKTAAGRMPDDELYRVLHLFFERGLVRLSA